MRRIYLLCDLDCLVLSCQLCSLFGEWFPSLFPSWGRYYQKSLLAASVLVWLASVRVVSLLFDVCFDVLVDVATGQASLWLKPPTSGGVVERIDSYLCSSEDLRLQSFQWEIPRRSLSLNLLPSPSRRSRGSRFDFVELFLPLWCQLNDIWNSYGQRWTRRYDTPSVA